MRHSVELSRLMEGPRKDRNAMKEVEQLKEILKWVTAPYNT